MAAKRCASSAAGQRYWPIRRTGTSPERRKSSSACAPAPTQPRPWTSTATITCSAAADQRNMLRRRPSISSPTGTTVASGLATRSSGASPRLPPSSVSSWTPAGQWRPSRLPAPWTPAWLWRTRSIMRRSAAATWTLLATWSTPTLTCAPLSQWPGSYTFCFRGMVQWTATTCSAQRIASGGFWRVARSRSYSIPGYKSCPRPAGASLPHGVSCSSNVSAQSLPSDCCTPATTHSSVVENFGRRAWRRRSTSAGAWTTTGRASLRRSSSASSVASLQLTVTMRLCTSGPASPA
mmetsp:Transcript_16643/g.64997  ORF Transcript_16643/g.64997 Transcript_16643/m.64997 type:complete len:293 (+) Transcript_16643:887-1765(+)